MGKVIFDASISLDGFTTAANRRPDEPMGDGGLRLVEWAMGDDERNRTYLKGAIGDLGAVIAGRVTYDTSLPWWGPNGPSQSARRPVFVVTHQAPAESPENGVYTFVTDGIQSALEQAQAAAGDKIVTVMGGANLGRQCLAAGLIDEVSIHLAPILLGNGLRLFDQLSEHVQLELADVLQTPAAVHLRYRLAR